MALFAILYFLSKIIMQVRIFPEPNRKRDIKYVKVCRCLVTDVNNKLMYK